MKTSIKLLGIFGVMLLAGAGCAGDAPTEESTAQGETSVSINSSDDLFSGDLAEALRLEKDMKCTWSGDEGSGTTYLSNNRIRTEVETDGESGIILAKDNCTYIWQRDSSEGIEFCQLNDILENIGIDEEDFQEDSNPTPDTSNPYDVDPGVEINCEVQKINDQLFEVPVDVSFTNPLENLPNF